MKTATSRAEPARHALVACLAALFALAPACKKKEPPPPAVSSAVVAASAPSAAPAPAATSGLGVLRNFEGRITFVAKGKLAGPQKAGDAALELALLVKDDRFRVDVPPGLAATQKLGNAYLLGRPEEQKLYVVADKQKQAILLDLDKLGPELEAFSSKVGQGNEPPPPVISKTGKVEQVAGYSCEIWQVTQDSSRSELCVAAESTPWLRVPLGKTTPKYAWAAELTDGKHFPLRFVAFDKGGAEEGRIELTKIEKAAIDAAQLDVPQGYTVVDLKLMLDALTKGLPAGMRGMPGMPDLPQLKGKQAPPVGSATR